MRASLALLIAATIAAPLSAQRSAKAVNIAKTSDALDFDYSWPAEAAAIRQLNKRFSDDAKTALNRALSDALSDMKTAKADKREFHQHFFSRAWKSAGQSQRLLSLGETTGIFTGGAHPNSNNSALLWDRKLAREIKLDALFLRTGAFEKLTRTDYCKRLGAERKKRRQGEKIGGQFDECPRFSELAIAPADKDKDRRFDHIRFIASPYVAGPYVEGDYEIDVPVSRQLMAAMKPLYRSSFEPQRQ